MNSDRQGPNIKRFTLIELLVTVFIIMVICSLILPVLRKSFASAKALNCLGNMHHLGIAFLLYADSNNGSLPHKDFGSDVPPSGKCWYTELDPFLGVNPPYRAKQDPDHLDLHSADEKKLGLSYKMNSRLEDYKGDKPEASPPFRQLSTINDLSRTVLLFDGRCDKIVYTDKPYGMYTSVESRHQDRAAMLFTDGNCKLMPADCDQAKHWTGPGGLYWDPDTGLDKQQ